MVPKVPLKMVYLNRTKAGTSTRRHSSLRFLLHDVKDRILLLEVSQDGFRQAVPLPNPRHSPALISENGARSITIKIHAVNNSFVSSLISDRQAQS